MTPFICAMDLIGCINFAKDFVVCGTSSPNMFGMCESLWQPDLVCIMRVGGGGGWKEKLNNHHHSLTVRETPKKTGTRGSV